VTIDDARRSQLLAAKLRVLVRSLGTEAVDPGWAPPGAAAVVTADGRHVVAVPDAPAGTGAALVVAVRSDRPVVLAVDGDDALVGRVAAVTRWWRPSPDVCAVRGTGLVAAAALPVAVPVPAPPPLDPADRAVLDGLAATMRDVPGVTVQWSAGLPVFAVRGLDLATVVVDGDRARLEVGINPRDRWAKVEFDGVHAVADVGVERLHAELADVAAVVLRHRSVDAPPHPLARYLPERWLRAVVVAEPGVAGLAASSGLEPVAGPWDDLPGAPAVAVGDGVVVACTVGVHPNAVVGAVEAADAVGGPDARLLVAVPARDVLPVLEELVGGLAPERHAELVAVADDWRARA
jgi:hypothetical protein